jgi:hypothetical protein
MPCQRGSFKRAEGTEWEEDNGDQFAGSCRDDACGLDDAIAKDRLSVGSGISPVDGLRSDRGDEAGYLSRQDNL